MGGRFPSFASPIADYRGGNSALQAAAHDARAFSRLVQLSNRLLAPLF